MPQILREGLHIAITKDIHWENTPSNKTEVLPKSMNMYIWEISTVNQLFVRDSYTQISLKKMKWQWHKSILSDRQKQPPEMFCEKRCS